MPDAETPSITLADALASFEPLRTTLEADNSLAASARGEQLRILWSRIADAGLSDEAAMRPAYFELLAWHFRPAKPEFGRQTPPRWTPAFELADGMKFPNLDGLQDRDQFFAYLAERAVSSPSPVHRARYADLLWEFHRDHTKAREAADAYLAEAVVLQDPQFRRRRQDALLRTLDVAARIGDSTRVANAKAAMASELQQCRVEQFPPLALDLLEWPIRLRRRYITATDISLAQAYARDASLVYRTATNADRLSIARRSLDLLSKLARRAGDATESQCALVEIGEVMEQQAALRSGESRLAEAGFLEDALRHYISVGAQDRLDDLKKRIRDANEAGQREMVPLGSSLTLDLGTIDRWIDEVSSLSQYESLMRAIMDVNPVPSMEKAIAFAEESADRFTLSHLFPNVLIVDGRRVSTAATPKERLHRKNCDYFSTQIRLYSGLLARVYERLFTEDVWTGDAIIAFLRMGSAFDENKLSVLRVGIDRYIAGDFVSALHIFVPHIEDALRRLRRKLGLHITSTRGDLTTEMTMGDVPKNGEVAGWLR